MMRLIPVLLAVVVLGCQGQEAHVPMDPFYGQTKIAPPGTGEIARRPAVDPYYPRSTATSPALDSQIASNASDRVTPSATSPTHLASTSSAVEASAPAGSGDRIEIPVSARRKLSPSELLAAKSAANSLEVAGTGTTVSGTPHKTEQISQTLRPRERSVAGQTSGFARPTSNSGRATPRGAPVDINYLPPADRGAGTMHDDRVQQASASQFEGGTAVRIPTRVDENRSKGRYGWADDYRRLRGRLEYLESDGSWKLRYIPVDHKTDDYGGSVVIADSSSLSGHERGDFVEVTGQIVGKSEDAKDFAPTFKVASIRGL